MLCLGIEATAHTFGVGIAAADGRMLANVKKTYLPKIGSGLVPREARDHHRRVADGLIADALAAADCTMEDIDVLSFSQGPGLPPCLHVGKDVVTRLAKQYKKSIVPVNHCIAHIEIGRQQTGLGDPMTVYVSGANTQVIGFANGRYRVFGETQDIGIGNALDKLGRTLGLPFPAGPEIENLAKKGSWTTLPYSVKGMDLAFSGILTAAEKKQGSKENVCFSFQETTFAMVTEVTERAVAHTGKEAVLLTGGVAANKRLQKMLQTMCTERGARFAVVPAPYAMDNGAMIAWTGLIMHKKTKPGTLTILPRQRTDDVPVTWR
ncbi:MAG: N(6)-L-threonylcarbamoyladenine synthase Kae1 [Nanoarchaeota archaeon]|nr:N(6)-L-threonylcarbamoyladenine synthase Kae1 [Nanoarchaeota archaeon]